MAGAVLTHSDRWRCRGRAQRVHDCGIRQYTISFHMRDAKLTKESPEVQNEEVFRSYYPLMQEVVAAIKTELPEE